MGRNSVRAVCHYRIYVEDDILALSTSLKNELEEKLIFTDDYMAAVYVEAEKANVQFLSYNNTYLFGIVSAVSEMDTTMLVYDTQTHKLMDTGRFSLSQFTYFLIDVNTGRMVSIYKKTAPNAARVLGRCFNSRLLLKVCILDELSESWKDRLGEMRMAEVTVALKDADLIKKPLAQIPGLERIVSSADRMTVAARWDAPGSGLIPVIEHADRSLYETLKIRGLNPSGRYDVIDFLKEEISLKTEIELTDREMREGGWETVKEKLIGAIRE